MADSAQPVLKRIIRGCSRVLLWAGAVVFLIGDAFLYEIKHVDFSVSLAVGVLSGLLLMLVGYGIGMAGKPRRSGQHFD